MVSEADAAAFAEALASVASVSRALVTSRLLEAVSGHSFVLAPRVFGSFVACRLEPAAPGDADDAFARLHLGDLYLACGCIEGVAGAADAFVVRYGSVIATIAAKPAGQRIGRDDLTQLVVARLLVADEGVPARIAQYRGTGPLLGFVRVTAARLAINATESRAIRAEVLTPTDDLFTAVFAPARDPEASFDRERARNHLRAAFETAAKTLEPRARNVLAFSLCDGLSIDAIARMYGVHRATAARWVQGARDSLIQGTREELSRALSVDDGELDSLFRDGLSRFELSVERCLRTASETRDEP